MTVPSEDVNQTGWYEVIHPTTATPEIVAVMEDGSIYCPAGVVTRGEFAYAVASGNAHRLVRADDVATRAAIRSAALFESAWDEGNAMGLDGWTGPERGEEPDQHAIDRRERTVDRLVDELRARIEGDSR